MIRRRDIYTRVAQTPYGTWHALSTVNVLGESDPCDHVPSEDEIMTLADRSCELVMEHIYDDINTLMTEAIANIKAGDTDEAIDLLETALLWTQ